jgi:hypothetical protein
MALLDIVGKHLGLPVAQLLGGYYRSEVPLSVSIANPDFEEDCNLAKALVADGVNIFKVKTGFSTHKEDLRRLEWLRANLPATVDLMASKTDIEDYSLVETFGQPAQSLGQTSATVPPRLHRTRRAGAHIGAGWVVLAGDCASRRETDLVAAPQPGPRGAQYWRLSGAA